MYNQYDIIELENNKEYVVVDSINYHENNYLYLASTNPKEKIYSIVKQQERPDGIFLQNIDSDDEYNEVVQVLTKKNADILLNMMKDKE